MRTNRAIAAVTLMIVFGAIAAEFFLVVLPIPYAQDMGQEYRAAQTAFSLAQNGPANRGWKPGDSFDVQYSDGVIAVFRAGDRGVVCAGGKCHWASTIPLDDVPTIKQGNDRPLIPRASANVSPGQVAPMALIDLHGLSSTTTWVITAGPLITYNPDGSVSFVAGGVTYVIPANAFGTPSGTTPSPSVPATPVNEQSADYVNYNQMAASGQVVWGEPTSPDIPRAFWDGGPLGGYGSSPLGTLLTQPSGPCPMCSTTVRRDNK